MSDDNKRNETLTDEDMVTTPKLSRRLLLAGAGVALGASALGGKPTLAADSAEDAGGTGDTTSDATESGDKEKDASQEGDSEKDATDDKKSSAEDEQDAD